VFSVFPKKQKLPPLSNRGGTWFESRTLKVHLGVAADFRPAKKAHPAFEVTGLKELIEAVLSGGDMK
jgi:hypothetical protein